MKMSRPTSVTITIITAESGSSTQPRSTVVLPNWSQVKLTVSRTEKPCDHPPRTWLKAVTASSNEIAKDPMAKEDESLRAGWRSNAITPEATMGSTGMSQRTCATEEAVSCGVNPIGSCITGSSLHPVQLIQVGGACMSIDRNHQPQ